MESLFGNVFFWVFGLPMAIGGLAMLLDFLRQMAKMKQKQLEMEAKLSAQATGDLFGWVTQSEHEALEARVAELERKVAMDGAALRQALPRSLDPIEDLQPEQGTVEA